MELSQRLRSIDETARRALAPVFAEFDRISEENTALVRKASRVGFYVCRIYGLRLYGQRQGCT